MSFEDAAQGGGGIAAESDPVYVAEPAHGVTATNITNWGTAYTQTRQWDGGATGLVAATGRTSLGLGSAALCPSTDFLGVSAKAADSDKVDGLEAAAFALLSQASPQTIGATGARLTYLWAADIACTNKITGSISGSCDGSSASCSGNASTVTTNANLTGCVTSTGNATSDTITAPKLATSMTLNKGIPVYRIMKNNSGGALAAGDVVILDTSDSAGLSVTTTATANDPKVFGVVTTGGNDQADITICVGGACGDVVKVDGTADIAVGDPLATFTTVKIAAKGAYATGGIFAIALEAYTTDNSSGVIKAWIL